MADHNIKQLTNRLEDATTTERLDALQELCSLARSDAHQVGLISLQRVLDLLREQGSADEYQEALDLIHRLIQTRDANAAMTNTNIILSQISNVELLLDLLEHEDLTVGVMTSQILTEIHAKDGAMLEKQIHDCPAGMNKLLQRLPDNTREEVRNQAIVLVQQLTAANEEMKKTVVFNEGFDILFGIISSEGGSADAGVVVQDCLHICSNILNGSETCQRLFYGMGNEWTMRLADFFDPSFLEQLPRGNSLDDSDIDIGISSWFDQPGRSACAVLAMHSLAKSLETLNAKHQQIVGISISSLIPAAAFWIGRKGPSDLLNSSLLLIQNVVKGNPAVGIHLLNTTIKIGPSLPTKNIPSNCDIPSLYFSWKPLPNDDRRMISLPALLAERYIFSCSSWQPSSGNASSSSSVINAALSTGFDTYAPDGLSQGCLHVLETILTSDENINVLTIQHVLAPPPPSPEDDNANGYNEQATSSLLEVSRPLGSLVLNTLVESCSKIVGFASSSINLQSQSQKSDVEIAERSANIFTLLFINGGQLAKELSTAISTSHTSLYDNSLRNSMQQQSSQQQPPQPILPFLLATAGRAARAQSGHVVLVALLRMLSAAACGCERAARQILEDPSNLFVVDLATVASETAGVPASVQVMSCLFLGACFLALPPALTSDQDNVGGTVDVQDNNRLSRRSFLSMIDSRIGLTRFSDILRRPLLTKGSSSGSGGGVSPSVTNLAPELFFTHGFKSFYETQVEAIRVGIFDFYAGATSGDGDKDSPHKQVLEMQKTKIEELELFIKELQSSKGSSLKSNTSTDADIEKIHQIETDKNNLQTKIHALENELRSRDVELNDMTQKESVILGEVSILRHRAEEAENLLREQQLDYLNNNNNSNNNGNINEDEILRLKESILNLDKERQGLTDIIEQRDRKIELLETEMRGPIPAELNREKKMVELETRNAELKQELWEIEAELNAYKATVAQSTTSASVIDIDSIEFLWNSVVVSLESFVNSAGIEIYTGDFVTNCIDRKTDFSSRVTEFNNILSDCKDQITSAAGTCSDIAEAAGANGLEGEEGTIKRLISCVENIRYQLDYVKEDFSSYQSDFSKLQMELEESQLTANEWEAQVVQLQQDLVNARVALSNEVSANTSNNQIVIELKQEITQLHQSIELKDKHHVDEIKILTSEKATLQRDLSSSQAVIDQMKQTAAAESSNANAQSSEVLQLTAELQKQKDALSALRQQLASITRENAQSKSDAVNLRKEIKDATETIANLMKEKENLNAAANIVSDKTLEIQAMKESFEVEIIRLQGIIDSNSQKTFSQSQQQQVKDANPFAVSSPSPFEINYQEAYTTQQRELTRLSKEKDILFNNLNEKEENYNNLWSLKNQIEGESAGIREVLSRTEEDHQKLQREYDDVREELNQLKKNVKDFQREISRLQSTLEMEQSEKVDLASQLQSEIIKQTNNSDTISNLQFSLAEKEKALQSALSAAATAAVAVAPPPQPPSSIASYNLKTPAKEPSTSGRTPGSSMYTGNRGGGGGNFTISNPNSHSPSVSTKEIAKLHAEIVQERRRLQSLQEQHSDLLGLLAQQEVELQVYRNVLETEAGSRAVTLADEESQRIAIEKYGSYTNFRNEDAVDDDDDNEDENDGINNISNSNNNNISPWRD